MPVPQSQPPQPISAPANPSRNARKMSQSNAASLRLPAYGSRTGASPMSFGAAMSGISFNNVGGFSFEKKSGVPGSYGARFYGDAHDSPHMPFSTSISMEPGSFAASSSAFGLFGSSYTRRSYAAAVSGSVDYGPGALSTSLASLTTGGRMGSLSHSYSRGQLETLMTLRSDAEHTKEYECCGIKHDGLHALLEHVEDQHPYSDPNHDAGFSPVTLAMDLDLGETDSGPPPSTTHSNRSSTSPRPVPTYPLTPTSGIAPKPDIPSAAGSATSTIAPLQLSDVLKSPPTDNHAMLPSMPSASTSSSPDNLPTPTGSDHTNSAPFAQPKITAASRGAFLGPSAKTGQTRFDRAFNEVVAGKAGLLDESTKPPGPTAVAPGVLFTAAAAMGAPASQTVVGRREGQAGATTPTAPADGKAATETKDTTAPDAAAAATAPAPAERPKAPEPQLPQPSLFTTHKAWRCPNPGCNKAYKQSNGLKYHLQKGQCDFAIHDAIDHGLTLEEAEERSRPYVCAVGAGCTKRYRQMNGLKYHYLNSGEHGEYGLRMLQNGTHPHPPSLPPIPKRDRSGQNGRANAAPYAVPTRPNNPAPRMGTWPAQPRTVNGSTAVGNGTTTPRAPAAVMTTTATTNTNATATPNRAPAAPAPAPAATTAAPPQTQAPKMPVQRGRDAVLFSSVDPLDV